MSDNLLRNVDALNFFKDKNLHYTISSRMIDKDMSIKDYVDKFYPYINLSQVESLFGFVEEYSSLYGGRAFNKKNTLDQNHILELYNNQIAISITLTNHYFSEDEYKENLPLLQKHHKKGNSIVCVNDDLAKRIKKDFPLYILKASLIKDLNTYEKVEEAFRIYDFVVVPMEMNDDDNFLNSLPNKDRVIVFANANCAYNCSSRICYSAISKKFMQKSLPAQTCSVDILPRDQLGHIFFDLKKLVKLGFTHFKLVPDGNIKRELEELRNIYSVLLNVFEKYKKVIYLFSFPKSGRTWLRYILANYINIYFKLDCDINLHTIFTLIPNDDLDKQKGLSVYRYVKDNRFPVLIASHKSLKPYDDRNLLVLLRNVYDLMVSEYFQHIHLLEKFKGSIKDFIREKQGSLYGYCKFINSLELNKNNAKIFTYEDMTKDISLVVKEILEYLDIAYDKDILENSVNLSTFKNMREDEINKGIPGYKGDPNKTNSLRMREGKVNNYSKYLDSEDIKYIKQYCENNLSTYSKKLLKEYGINFNGSIV